MIKSITKEIFIIILLILAILLILCILFYDYRPSTKKIPVPVAEYILPDTVQEELNETIKALETQNIVKTYYIDASDLKGYVLLYSYCPVQCISKSLIKFLRSTSIFQPFFCVQQKAYLHKN